MIIKKAEYNAAIELQVRLLSFEAHQFDTVIVGKQLV